MLDQAITAAISLMSGSLMCWWFRYACLLILTAKTPYDVSDTVARANRLLFPSVRSQLCLGAGMDCDALHRRLERDFAVLTYLLRHTASSSLESPLEVAMLAIHYRVSGIGFRISRFRSEDAAVRALEGMLTVVIHLANVMGARSAARG